MKNTFESNENTIHTKYKYIPKPHSLNIPLYNPYCNQFLSIKISHSSKYSLVILCQLFETKCDFS